MFPGCTEFDYLNFWNLPVNYVLDAFTNGKKAKNMELHQAEAPIALLSSLFANANRDSKKKKEPYKMEDFFLFEPRDIRNIPTSVYGSAAMALAEKGLLPSWALFVFKDLKEAADGSPPSLLAYVCEDVVVLAPVHAGRSLKGMIIAKQSASNRKRRMTSPCGRSIYLQIPLIDGKFFAREDVELDLIN